MTKPFLAGVLLVVATLSLSSQSPNSDSGQSKQLLALENAWNQAEMKGDNGALDLLLSSEFV